MKSISFKEEQKILWESLEEHKKNGAVLSIKGVTVEPIESSNSPFHKAFRPGEATIHYEVTVPPLQKKTDAGKTKYWNA